MITVYRIGWVRGNAIDGPPEAVQVEQVGWPHRDVDGKQQFENTHFATEIEAWEALLANVKAGQSLSESRFTQCQSELAAATQRLADDAATRSRMDRAFELWQRGQLQDASPAAVTRRCESCVLGGDPSEKPCELREDTGIPGGSAWLCADCYAQWKEQP